jgi:ribosomal protein S8
MPKDNLSDFIVRFNNRANNILQFTNTKKIKQIISLLRKENFINYKVINQTQKFMTIRIETSTINSLKLISKQSRHVYKSHNDLLTDSRINQRLGFYVLTNSEYGWITSNDALEKRVGGKIILWIDLFS